MHVDMMHRQAVLVDAHCDTLTQMPPAGDTLVERLQQGHVDLPRLREGGVDLQFFAAYIAPEYKPVGALRRVLQLIDIFHQQVVASKGQMVLIERYADIEQCVQKNLLGALLSVEGGEAIEADLGVLRMLYRLGVRSIGLTWNQRNSLAEGVGEEAANGGLTKLGADVVREMNSLGMLIDVAHMAERSFFDVLQTSAKPIIASHANCRGLCDHPRNLRDEQIRALAQSGGVIGITFCPPFVSESPPGVREVVNHIDYACNLAGTDHVGLGSDFDGIPQTPVGLEDATCWPRLTEEMAIRGYQDAEIRAVLGGNVLRVLREVLVP